MTTVELKAQAYDILSEIERLQRGLSQVNQQIIKATQALKKEEDVPPKPE